MVLVPVPALGTNGIEKSVSLLVQTLNPMIENPQESIQDLEKDKLELEIRELSKPWYKIPRWWTIIITGAAVVGTLFLSWATGLISVQREHLENEKALLGIEIHEFEGQRDLLLLDMMLLNDSIQRIGDSLNIVATKYIATEQQNKQLRQEKFSVEKDRREMFDYYETYIDSLVVIIGKYKAIQSVLTYGGVLLSEDGTPLLSEDGNLLLNESILTDHDGIPITDHNGKPIRTK